MPQVEPEVLHGVGLTPSRDESLLVSLAKIRVHKFSTNGHVVSGMFQGTAFIEILKTGRMVELAFL